MAFTQTDLDTLNAAIASGELRVQYRDKAVQYRSLSEMLQIRKMMQEELGLTPPVTGAGWRATTYYDKGLCDE